MGATAVSALETDQFWAWGRPLRDSTDVLNAEVNAEIESVLVRVNERWRDEGLSCEKVTSKIQLHMRMLLFQRVENWAVSAPEVDRAPGDPREVRQFRREHVYSRPYPFDAIGWMPKSPTIEIAGVRVGTDKINHFFAQGAELYRAYRWTRRKGASPEQAERYAIRWGLVWERTILGMGASGVLSQGDLEANDQGMRFYAGLCEGDSPGLVRVSDGWRLARPFDFRDYVTPEWDESYQPSVYAKGRWNKVEPRLERYCAMLDEPSVRERRERYRLRDADTASEAVVRDLVAEGLISDPSQFSIESVCREAAARAAAGGAP